MANKFGEMSLDNDGYVVYRRKSTMAYREADRYRQETRIMGYFKDLDFSEENEIAMIETVSQTLMTMAQNERAKELALLESITGKQVSIKDEMDFVKNFNDLTEGARQYSEAVQRLQEVLASNKDNRKVKGPTPGSLFFSTFQRNFGTSVNHYIYGYITRRKERGIGQEDLEQMTNWIYDKIFPSCLEKTMEELLVGNGATDSENREFNEVYEKIFVIFKSNELLRQMFVDTMRTAFNMESIKKIITSHKGALQKGEFSRKKGVGIKGGAWARRALEVKTRTNKKISVGDKFDEFLEALTTASLPQQVIIGNNGTIVHENNKFTGDMKKMDGMEIFSMEVGINREELEGILQEFENISNNTSGQTYDALTKFNELNERLQRLTNTFVVYRSNILQKINNIGKGSFNAGAYNLSDLEIIMQNNINSGLNSFGRMNIHKFMRVVCNTVDGAILDNNKFTVDFWLQSFVFESLASILFTDWERIGEELKSETGPNSIHIMTLNGVDIPISVFLFGAAEAFYDLIEEGGLSEMVRTNITKRPKILYPTPHSYEIGKGVNGEKQPLVNEAWEKQRIDAMNRIKIEIRFYKNFRDSILERLNL